MKVEESLNVKFDESSPPTKLSPLVDDDVSEEEVIERKVTSLSVIIMAAHSGERYHGEVIVSSLTESLNVKFDESSPPTKLSPLVDDDVSEEEVIERKVKVDNNVENESIEVDEERITKKRTKNKAKTTKPDSE
ncbi:hypothetical protein Tco_0770560 [Tanacetum coccineum]|uniref:Uncharacterized protein n=1 Tax=Tanacetum coccineum TaxID=301880 RepID=A0ABQ4ZCL0_9ASTR